MSPFPNPHVVDRSASFFLQMGTLVERGGRHLWWSGRFVYDGAQGFPLSLCSCHGPADLRPSSSPANSAACAGDLRGGKEGGEILVSLRPSDPLHLLHPTPCLSDTGLPMFTMYFQINSNLLAASMFARLFLILSQLGKYRFRCCPDSVTWETIIPTSAMCWGQGC